MTDGFFKVNINSIAETKKIMDNSYNELISMINKYKEMIEQTKGVYDTESATLYRKIALAYTDLMEKSLVNEIKPYIDKLDEIRKIYIDEYNSVANSVQGENI